MAYDDSTFRRRDPDTGSRAPRLNRPSTFAEESAYDDDAPFGAPSTTSRYGSVGFGAAGHRSGVGRNRDVTDTGVNTRRSDPIPVAVLDGVFDDPEHGDPGRDRMRVHGMVEIALLLAVGVLAYVGYARDHDSLRGAQLSQLLVLAAGIGLITVAAGLSLRAGAVNLAIGPVAVAAGVHFAEHGDRGVGYVVVTAGIAAAVAGVALAAVVVGFQVPGWAGGLGLALVVAAYLEHRAGSLKPVGAFDPKAKALIVFGGVVVIAVLGGVLGAIQVVRRAVGRFRPVGDPARRRGAFAAIVTGGALVASTVLAAVGGVLLAADRAGLTNSAGEVVPTSGLEWTGIGVGAALLGGTSAFGRRGGVFGAALAATLAALAVTYAQVRGVPSPVYAVAAAAVVAGLIVTRAVETYGRPRSGRDDREDDDWASSAALSGPVPSTSWTAPRQESWSSALPAQPTTAGTDPWDEGR